MMMRKKDKELLVSYKDHCYQHLIEPRLLRIYPHDEFRDIGPSGAPDEAHLEH